MCVPQWSSLVQIGLKIRGGGYQVNINLFPRPFLFTQPTHIRPIYGLFQVGPCWVKEIEALHGNVISNQELFYSFRRSVYCSFLSGRTLAHCADIAFWQLDIFGIIVCPGDKLVYALSVRSRLRSRLHRVFFLCAEHIPGF